MCGALPDLSCEVGGFPFCNRLEASPSGFIKKSFLFCVDSACDRIVGSDDIEWLVRRLPSLPFYKDIELGSIVSGITLFE